MGYKDPKNILVGDPNDIKVNLNTSGYSEQVNLKTTISKDDFRPGTPGRLVKSTPTEFGINLDAMLNELRFENLLLAMAIGDDTVEKILGATITAHWQTFVTRQNNHAYAANAFLEPAALNGFLYEVTAGGGGNSGGSPPTYPTTITAPGNTVTDGDLTLTCRAYPAETVSRVADGSNYYYKLADGYNISTVNPPIVYNSALTDKLSEGTDYHVDYVQGKIIATSDLGATLKVLHKYTKIDQVKLLINPDEFKFNTAYVVLEFTNKDTGERIEFEFFQMQSDGKFSTTMNEGRSSIKTSLQAMKDEYRAGYEFGKISFYPN